MIKDNLKMKMTENLRELWKIFKKCNMNVTELQEANEIKNKPEEIFEMIMAKNF